MYQEDRIYIQPIVNEMDITRENRTYASYATYPILLEKKLTNSVVNRFSIDGHLSVASVEGGALRLQCQIRDYRKVALRYDDADDVEEQRLRLYVHMTLSDSKGDVINEATIVGETSYFLSGSLAKTESIAQEDLIEDTARRIVESVIENW